MQREESCKQGMNSAADFNYSSGICLCSHKAQLLCISHKCKNSAMVCLHTQCNLQYNDHQKCNFITYDTLIQKVLKKRREPTNQMRQTAAQLLKIYDEAIDKLSKDRESITIWQQNFGFSCDDYRFLQLIRNNRSDLITGQLVQNVFHRVSQQDKLQRNSQYFTKKYINMVWKQQKEAFQLIFQKFNVLFKGYDHDFDKQLIQSKNKEQQKHFISLARKSRWQNILRDFNKHKTLEFLSCLEISARSITRIPNIKFMPNVTKLWLNSNRISKIQHISQQFPLLQCLYLQRNQIQKIEHLQGLTKLRQIMLQNNRIQVIENLQNLMTLAYIDLSQNPLVNRKDQQPNLQKLIELRNRQVKVKIKNRDFIDY